MKDALLQSIKERKPGVGTLFHSDQGVQYASYEIQNILVENNMFCSMSRKVNCWDKAVAESFFDIIKSECLYHEHFKSRDDARQSVLEYI